MAIKWYSDNCPKCEAENFVCDGNPENLARSDVTGFRCRKCGETWPLNKNIKEIMPNWAEDVRDGICLVECAEENEAV